MAQPSPRPTFDKLNALERELYRYYQPEPSIEPGPSDRRSSRRRRSACDPCLTSFAQLAALRMNARRGIISLTTPKIEYILAEAGRTLSLQEEDDSKDKLWHGVGQLEGNGLGPDTIMMFADPKTSPSHVVIPDALLDPKYKDKDLVAGYNNRVRFVACVPIRTPHRSTAIGMVIVVDDKPRDGITSDEVQYLLDLSTTVMEYLEAGRTKMKQHRAESMVKALGLFVEGRTSLRDWWLEGGHNIQHSNLKKGAKYGETLESRADSEFGIQDSADKGSVEGIEELDRKNSLTHRPTNSTAPSTDLQSEKGQFSVETESIANNTIETETKGGDSQNESSYNEEPGKLQEALVSPDVMSVFSRASNLIREATQVCGVAFYDASIGSFGGSRKGHGASFVKGPGEFHVNGKSESVTESSEEDLNHHGSTSVEHTHNDHISKTCNILGYSTRSRSSARSHYAPKHLRSFPEYLIRRLLKRYPHGKVFNYDGEGAFWTSDSDGGNTTGSENLPAPSAFVKNGRTSKTFTKEDEAAMLLTVVPGARSVIWYPLWDQSKERWFSGVLVWSTNPTRVLCPSEDLTYLAAFGNSVMAEVSRLAAQVAAQMKNDFISSISHELRSPLHGVLASVEFLQDTEMTEIQADMVNNISASGKVLLDTINHVLDFSKVNKKVKQRPKRFRRRGGKLSKTVSPERTDTDGEDLENICVLSEEVVNSVYAGRNMGRLAREISAGRISKSDPNATRSPVTVIMSVANRSNWSFRIDAGAWRRILMNLFSNALKYTSEGFVKVQISIEKMPAHLGQKARPNLLLQISDSGKGISQEFLRHQLYKPFAQEDSLAVGTGLGVSIVKQIIQGMGGEINITSEVGVGTEVKCRIPLTTSRRTPPDEHNTFTEEVRSEVKGRVASFAGFDKYPEISETPTGILSADAQASLSLKCSMKTTLDEWFGIQERQIMTNDSSAADLQVLLEDGFTSDELSEKIKHFRNSRLSHSSRNTSVTIVLCSDLQHSRPNLDRIGFKVLYLSQPYGPLKLAKALHNGFADDDTEEPSSDPQPLSNPNGENGKIELPTRENASRESPDSPPSPGSVTPIRPQNGHPQHNTPSGPARRKSSKPSVEPFLAEGMKILLVEDNEINMKLLVTYMQKLNIEYTTAINGLEALNAYKKVRGGFDIILMDISMPVMSGLESTQHIRSHEAGEGLKPVLLIALSGAANPAARQEAYACGIDLFLTKPVPLKSLRSLLEDFKTKGRDGLEI
ncbi:Sensor protein GacS [Phlyctema vagabunda]|uniref:histidine kinase n=1 Tax=Phlyctema vagabunda TaxID=108571 RepID=A0ABR4P9T0_9HELO